MMDLSYRIDRVGGRKQETKKRRWCDDEGELTMSDGLAAIGYRCLRQMIRRQLTMSSTKHTIDHRFLFCDCVDRCASSGSVSPARIQKDTRSNLGTGMSRSIPCMAEIRAGR